jgi:8-oxo-dGTP diphosphatase
VTIKIRNKAIPAVYLFLEKGGKLLVAHRANTGYQDGCYHVPAGHVDEGELPTEALIREAREEIGVELKSGDVELVHVSYRPQHDATDDRIDFFFRVRKWSGEVKNMEPHKCDELKWISPDDLPKNMALHIRRAIEAVSRKLFFEEIGLEELKKHGLYVP